MRQEEVASATAQAARDWLIIEASEALARQRGERIDAYLQDFYGRPKGGLGFAVGQVLRTDGSLALTAPPPTTSTPNPMYPYVVQSVATIVPTEPRVQVAPARRGRTEEEREALARAARVRELVIRDQFKKGNFVYELRRATATASLMGYAAVWQKYKPSGRGGCTEFEATTPLDTWFDPEAARPRDVRWYVRMTMLDRFALEQLLKKVKANQGALAIPDKRLLDPSNAAYRAGVFPDWYARHVYEDLASVREVIDQQSWCVAYDFYDMRRRTLTKWVVPTNGTRPRNPLFVGPLPTDGEPVHILTLNDNLRNAQGIPDPTLIAGAMNAQEDLQTMELHHARNAVSVLLANRAEIADYDAFVTAYRNAGSLDVVGWEPVTPGTPAERVFKWTETPRVQPDLQRAIARADAATRTILAIPDHAPGAGVDLRRTPAAAFHLSDAMVRTAAASRADAVQDVVRWAGVSVIHNLAEWLSEDSTFFVRYGEEADPAPLPAPPAPGMPGVAPPQPPGMGGIREFLAAPPPPLPPPVPELEEVDRRILRLPSLVETRHGYGLDPEHEDEFDYHPVPYSGQEGTRMARLRLLEAWREYFAVSPNIDKRAFDEVLLRELQFPELLLPRQAVQAAAQAAVQPPGGAAPGVAPGTAPVPVGLPAFPGEDSLATGALPASAAPQDDQTPFGGPGFPAPARG